jgi:hypothetical protein
MRSRLMAASNAFKTIPFRGASEVCGYGDDAGPKNRNGAVILNVALERDVSRRDCRDAARGVALLCTTRFSLLALRACGRESDGALIGLAVREAGTDCDGSPIAAMISGAGAVVRWSSPVALSGMSAGADKAGCGSGLGVSRLAICGASAGGAGAICGSAVYSDRLATCGSGFAGSATARSGGASGDVATAGAACSSLRGKAEFAGSVRSRRTAARSCSGRDQLSEMRLIGFSSKAARASPRMVNGSCPSRKETNKPAAAVSKKVESVAVINNRRLGSIGESRNPCRLADGAARGCTRMKKPCENAARTALRCALAEGLHTVPAEHQQFY